RRRLPRLAGARRRRSDAPALRPRLPGAVDRPGERRGPDPLARPRVQVPRDRARADRGAHRRAPGGGWRGGALRRADGVRRARAHLVDEAWNPAYHRVLREFERRTGIGAVLNTSFNLHGEPLVGSAEDAVDTFERSGLSHLALDRWMISKK